MLKFKFSLVLLTSNIIFSDILASVSENIKSGNIKSNNMVYLSSHALNYLSSAMDNVYKANSSLIQIGAGFTVLRCVQKKRYKNLNFDVFNSKNKLIKKIGNKPSRARLKKLQDTLLKFQANISRGGSEFKWFTGSYLAEGFATALVAKTAADNYLLGAQYEAEKERQKPENANTNKDNIDKNETSEEFDKGMFNDQVVFDKVYGPLSTLGLSSLGEKVEKAHNDISRNKVYNKKNNTVNKEEDEKIRQSLKEVELVKQIQKNQSYRSFTGILWDSTFKWPLVAFAGNLGADAHYTLENLEKNINIDQAMKESNYNKNFGIRKCPCSGHSYGANNCMCKCDTQKKIKDVTLDDVVAKGHGAFLGYKLHSNDLT